MTAIILSAYFGYVTSQLSAITNKKTEEISKKQETIEIATISEQMRQVHLDINNMNNLAKELGERVRLLDKQMAVIDERLKNATTKSLMAAGATKEQALQFWKNPASSLPQDIPMKKY